MADELDAVPDWRTMPALEIKPGATYVIEHDGHLTMEMAELIKARFTEATGANCVFLSNGLRLSRDKEATS